MTHTHADCRHFNPDPIGRAGLGSCAENIELGYAALPVWHKGQLELHYQARLVWPGGEACVEFEGK